MYLHVTQPGAVLSRREGRLQVLLEDRRLADVGTASLEGVVLWGANATVPALRLLLAREIPLVFLDQRGRYRGRLEPPWSGHAYLRDRQRLVFERRRVELAGELVARKLLGQARVLDRWARRGEPREIRDVARLLRSAAAEARRASDLAALRGLEGSGAREYFRAVSRALPGGFERSRRPPRDVVNAALSVAYAQLLERCLAAVSIVGFDPLAGIYHGRKHGRPALALDLMEPLRPAVDRIVFGAARRGELRASLAKVEAGGCYLTPEGFERVLSKVGEAFQREVPYLGSHRPLWVVPVEQARALARAVTRGEPFTAFELPRD
jgi:CRISPR-associated protein Cas1